MRFVIHALSTEGYAIVAAETAETIDRAVAPYVLVSEASTWGDFRRCVVPIEVVTEVIESELGDMEDYLEALESAGPPTGGDTSLEERWRLAAARPFGGDEEHPADDDEFGWVWGSGDPDLEVDLRYRSAMLSDLPGSVIDEFDLVEDTALDGDLGRVTEDLDAVVEELGTLGHSVG